MSWMDEFCDLLESSGYVRVIIWLFLGLPVSVG